MCLKRAVEDAIRGLQLDEEERRCLEEAGLYGAGLLAPRPYLIYRALERGVQLDLSSLSRQLSWQEFEEVILHILEGWGYSARRGVRLNCGGHRAEFDVVAWSKKYVLAIEAKHWKYGGGKWAEVARSHAEKTRRCLEGLRPLAPRVVPIVVTLTSIGAVVEGVPVLSISLLPDFLRNIDYLGDQILIFI
ncbi:MAG: nuclease-related domain-containing protein [Thermoproteus sp.]